MKFRTLKFIVAASVAAFMVSCSSDKHSTNSPEEDDPQLSSSVDLDALLGLSSSSEAKSSSSVVSKASSDSKTSDSKETASSSSKAGTSSSGVVTPVESSIKRSACDSKMDNTELQALDATNSKAFDMFKALTKEDLDGVKDLSAEVKPMYAKILKKYPNSCGAQLGYAVANLFDLSNNSAIETYVDQIREANDETVRYDDELRVAKFLNVFTAKVGENISVHTQNIIAREILPSLDTSIAYMQNIMAQDDYTLEFMADGKKRQLDKSEFGPALGTMFGTKALLTMVVSMNLNFDDNGSYDWFANMEHVALTDVGTHNAKQTAAIKFLNELLGKKGVFSAINKGWEAQWKSIPALIDSALRETRVGLKYSIKESTEEGSQDYDIYVVGDGADADVNTKDLQDFISAIDVILNEVLDGPYLFVGTDFDKDFDIQVTVDIRKLFENTDGYEPFLPYYKFKDPSDFGTLYFTNAAGDSTASIREYQDMSQTFTQETLYNKMFFPDPTFGGLFPKLKTQKDVWDLLIALDKL